VATPRRTGVERGLVVLVEGVLRPPRQPPRDAAAHDHGLYVIVSNDVANLKSRYPLVVPLKIVKPGDTIFGASVFIAQGEAELRYNSVADCAMIFTIPRTSIQKRYGKLSDQTMLRIDHALMVSLGLDRSLDPPGKI
jgi:mRNA-degrading endonuclease toxin of MazEF toxin-antitoxin module